MLLPMLYHLADVIAFFNVVVVGKLLHYMYGLIMGDVIAKWQDGTEQNLIPDMWQMVLAIISIQGWIIDPDVDSFFDGSQ